MKNNYQDYDWFLKNDLSQYAGKWLAIIDRKIISVGDDAEKVIREAKKEYPSRRPLITKIRNKLSIL